MTLLKGLSGIKQLTSEQQTEFEQFYRDGTRVRLLPIIADFTLLVMLFNATVNIVIQYKLENSWSSVHPLAYLFFMSVVVLGLGHRFTALRTRAPLMVYLVYFVAATFSYRDFVIENGWLEPVYGMFLLLAMIGYISLSIAHTLALLAINGGILVCVYSLVYGPELMPDKLAALMSERYVLSCLLMSTTSVFFVQWLFRNLFAMQFLLNHKNAQLSDTLGLLKSTEQELIQQQKYQALNHMAKGLLHEIVNPVNSASQALSFARSVNEDEDVADALEEALAQQQRISDIISDLRHFAQPEQQTKVEDRRLAELLARAIGFCQRDLDRHQIEITVDIQQDQLVACQPSAMTQVFVNVIVNACDALAQKKSAAARKVRVSCQEQSDQLLIVFRDNGPGMTAEALERIGDPFVSSRASPQKMGLGLSICHTILRHHGGSLEIVSEPGEWTEVTLKLPVVNHADRIDRAGQENRHGESGVARVNDDRASSESDLVEGNK